MSTKKITEFGLLLAVSLIFSYVETLVPVIIAVPGIKLGLANMITIMILYRLGGKEAVFFMTLRVVMAGFLFSGVSGILYGLSGGILSIVIMKFLKNKNAFSVLGVSIAGAIFHNAGQIIVAMFIMENVNVLYYFAVLLMAGAVSGLAVGYLSYLLMKQYNKLFPEQ